MKKVILLLMFVVNLNGCHNEFKASDNGISTQYTYEIPTNESVAVPTLSHGVGIETGDFGLHWSQCNLALSYELEKNTFFDGTNIIYKGKATSYEVGQIPSGQTMSFRVRANYDTCNSKWSDYHKIP